MGDRTSKKKKKVPVINASEIGQYYFCSVAWYLQKQGYKPDSPLLDVGVKKHVEHGNVIDNVERFSRRSNVFRVIGYIILLFVFLIILFEVVL